MVSTLMLHNFSGCRHLILHVYTILRHDKTLLLLVSQGALQQLYLSSCPATTGIPAQSQVNAQCTSLPAPPIPANACSLPFRTITEVFQELVVPAPTTSVSCN